LTPTAADYLDKARNDLDESLQIQAIGLVAVTARSAYFAAFHAAEPLIFERSGKIAKTHSGVRAEFSRLMKGANEEARVWQSFLAKAYKYKEISDYGVCRAAVVTLIEAQEALESATRFVAWVEAQLRSFS
jgi:uncharacterized protein (UPF0332 family)